MGKYELILSKKNGCGHSPLKRGVQGCVYNEYPAEVKAFAIQETTAQNMKKIRPNKDTHPLIPSQEGKTDKLPPAPCERLQ